MIVKLGGISNININDERKYLFKQLEKGFVLKKTFLCFYFFEENINQKKDGSIDIDIIDEAISSEKIFNWEMLTKKRVSLLFPNKRKVYYYSPINNLELEKNEEIIINYYRKLSNIYSGVALFSFIVILIMMCIFLIGKLAGETFLFFAIILLFPIILGAVVSEICTNAGKEFSKSFLPEIVGKSLYYVSIVNEDDNIAEQVYDILCFFGSPKRIDQKLEFIMRTNCSEDDLIKEIASTLHINEKNIKVSNPGKWFVVF